MSVEPPSYLVRYKPLRGGLHPIIRFGLRAGETVLEVTAYVDSGAAVSIFEPGCAERLGLDFRRGRRIHVMVGDGGTIPVYLHRVQVLLGQYTFAATVGFSDRLGVGFNLLGRRDLFSRLSFTFNDYHHFLLIQNARRVPKDLVSRVRQPARRGAPSATCR